MGGSTMTSRNCGSYSTLGSPGTKLSAPPPSTSAIGYGSAARRDSQPSTTAHSSRKTRTCINAMAGPRLGGPQRAVAQLEHAARALRQLGVVRDEHEGGAARARQPHHGVEDLVRGLRV